MVKIILLSAPVMSLGLGFTLFLITGLYEVTLVVFIEIVSSETIPLVTLSIMIRIGKIEGEVGIGGFEGLV